MIKMISYNILDFQYCNYLISSNYFINYNCFYHSIKVFTLSINQKSLLICFSDSYYKNQEIGITSDSMMIEKLFILGAYIINSSCQRSIN